MIYRVCFFVAALVLFTTYFAHARDLGQWDDVDQSVRDWYTHLMQPDNPGVSCCGEGDAYWCEDVHIKDGHTFCTIVDDRPDEPLRRMPIPLGTEVLIPDGKLTWKDGNPTGHAIMFGRPHYGTDDNGTHRIVTSVMVYCYVQGSGT